MEPWGLETTGPFVMNVIDAGHFLDSAATRLAVDAIAADLR
jgi:hypothetical protein